VGDLNSNSKDITVVPYTSLAPLLEAYKTLYRFFIHSYNIVGSRAEVEVIISLLQGKTLPYYLKANDFKS
jgi:hypothetical protein